MAQVKREVLKSADICELTQLQPYVLRSWEAEFPALGRPATSGTGRLYHRADIDLVLRIKELVFVEGLTLAGARRRLDEEREASGVNAADVLEETVLDEAARERLKSLRVGLESILAMLNRGAGHAGEFNLVAAAAGAPSDVTAPWPARQGRAGKAAAGKRQRAN